MGKKSVENSKHAEKRTKEVFKEAEQAQKEATKAVGQAVESRKEAQNSQAEVATLTSRLRNMETAEEKMEGVISVLEKQTKHNGNTMNVLEAHENALDKIFKTTKSHAAVLNETVTWTSSLTEGLEHHQEAMEKQQNAITEDFELDKKQ